MKTNIIRVILIVLLMGTFFIIFGFSNQNGEESGGLSKRVTEEVTKNVKSIQNLEKNQKENLLQRIEKVIRKIAHFSIYTVVGLLLMGLMSTYKLDENNRISISLITGVIYASMDEIHQSFIPGRSSQITDVMIDSLGVLCGILILMLILQIATKKGKKFKNKEI